MGVQVRWIMGEKVLLLIAALELWPALWNTKDRSDTLQWLGLVNICPTSGMPRFLLTSPTNLNPDPHIHCTSNSLSSAFYSPGEATGRHTHTCVHAPHAMHVGSYLVTAANEILALSLSDVTAVSKWETFAAIVLLFQRVAIKAKEHRWELPNACADIRTLNDELALKAKTPGNESIHSIKHMQR